MEKAALTNSLPCTMKEFIEAKVTEGRLSTQGSRARPVGSTDR
jgi:hypothetical protein